MRTVFTIALAAGVMAATPPALAEKMFAFAQSSDGARVLLYDQSGPCVGAARLAEHISPDGTKTPGCWLLLQGTVLVSFLDGERGDIPVSHLRRLADS
jgi:hypothetical protein